ncbi:MiaB/RimO family radical SAM methylthiotransferase [bacterium]|nr:MiaB/RimO family radical SAM methylthiotransferase [bacterium]
MKPVFIKTFGCKVNYSESVAFADVLKKYGYQPLELTGSELPSTDELERPVVFVNSCCVTKEAERKAAQFVRRIKREHPQSSVLFTGCAARNHTVSDQYRDAGAEVFDFYPQAFAYLDEVLEGNARRTDAMASETRYESSQAIDTAALDNTGIVGLGRSRAFIKVQDGCHNMCTFCIIPFVRPYASLPFDEIIAQVDGNIAGGVREIVLTGVNIGHYGMTPVDTIENIASDKHWRMGKLYERTPGHPDLSDLMDSILNRLPQGTRLRISSIEPEDIDDRFYAQLRHPRMAPHVHLPLQSGSDGVLTEMRRLYDTATYREVATRIRAAIPHGALTTDILVGFPTETDEQFAETLDFCTEMRFERIHGFPYSPRPGTRAGRLPQLPRDVVQERNRRLIAHCGMLGEQQWQRFVGRTAQVLLEEEREGMLIGHGEAYQVVQLPVQEGIDAGNIVELKLTGLSEGVFSAEPVREKRAQSV